jgi:hypothetical protein
MVLSASQPLTDGILDEVERITRSETFRSSEVLRQLLKFLAEKSAAGEADQLKEYTIAVDALDKAPTYDPRHDSAVRIQVGRLRHKLAEYYRTEGKDDELIVELPKGHFKLTCTPRIETSQNPTDLPSSRASFRKTVPWLATSMWLMVLVAVGLWVYFAASHTSETKALAISPGWTPELEELWRPFLNTNRPTILVIEDPLFVELSHGSGIYYRDRSINQWDDAVNSPYVTALRKAMKQPDARPSRYYTTLGELDAAFSIARLFGKEPHISLAKISQLSWQQVADNNVLFVGAQSFFNSQMHAMQVQPVLVRIPGGVGNLHPISGEPGTFSDRFSTAPTEEGYVYALVTHLPGPLGTGHLESFTSGTGAGYAGAVQSFTDPNFARIVVTELKRAYGKMPQFYQVLLKIEFKDGVPTGTSVVLTRELH